MARTVGLIPPKLPTEKSTQLVEPQAVEKGKKPPTSPKTAKTAKTRK